MNELEIIRHRRIDGLTLFFDTVDYRTPHFHPEWEIIWLLDGALSLTYDQQHYRVEAGELLLFSPGRPHEFHKIDRSGTFLCLQASPELFRLDRRLAADSLFPARYLPDTSIIKKRLLTLAGAYFERKPQYEFTCIGETCLLFGDILSAIPTHVVSREEQERLEKRNQRLLALIRFVDDNYMHKIRLSDFAEAENCSMHYLSHFVKDALNQSFQEYVGSVRLNCACKLMADGDRRLLDICEESGFSDYRYFSRAFKRQFGMTPEQYRDLLVKPETAEIVHSLHSLERFYSDEESKTLLSRLSV